MDKKRRIESGDNGTEKENPEELIIQRPNASIVDVPEPILYNILSRLPTKSIVFCKSVCRMWRNLISDPQFAKDLFAKTKPQFLLRPRDSTHIGRTLLLVDTDEEDGRVFDLKENCHCRSKLKVNFVTSDCHIDLNVKLKIPVRNADQVMLNNNQADSKGPENGTKRKPTRPKLKPKDHRYKIANSCHRLLCLSEPLRNDPVSVCNPVTGDFMNLPPAFNEADDESFVDCGLGFSPKSNEYKVIRVFTRPSLVDPIDDYAMYDGAFATYSGTIAEVHTLGTDSWRRVLNAPYSRHKLEFPTYCNGALYCFCINHDISDCIISFNFDDEQFEPLPLPPEVKSIENRCLSIGVLKGDLSFCDASRFGWLEIWVMKSCGVRKSWTKLFSMDQSFDRWPYYLYQPVNYFNNGALLMFRNYESGLLYFEPEHSEWKYLWLNGLKRYELIAYSPSFISLKDILVGCDAEILNVNSRCGKLKLPGETRAISLDRFYLGLLDKESCEFEQESLHKHFWKKY